MAFLYHNIIIVSIIHLVSRTHSTKYVTPVQRSYFLFHKAEEMVYLNSS
jgi:hypothetical protein